MTVHAKLTRIGADAGVLIIGAGQAGATAASALRQFGCEVPITLIGAAVKNRAAGSRTR